MKKTLDSGSPEPREPQGSPEPRKTKGPDLGTEAGKRGYKLTRLFAEHPRRAQQKDLARFFGSRGLNGADSKITKLCENFVDARGEYLSLICEFFDIPPGWFADGDPYSPIPSKEDAVEDEARSTINFLVKRHGLVWAAETLVSHAPRPNETTAPAEARVVPLQASHADETKKAAQAAAANGTDKKTPNGKSG